MPKDYWIPIIHYDIPDEVCEPNDDDPNNPSYEFEISVARMSNTHVRQSWGWHDKDNILIGSMEIDPETQEEVDIFFQELSSCIKRASKECAKRNSKL